MRFFNTAGPVDGKRHYCLPPLERLDFPQVLLLIEQRKYFVLHAPRQTGKTSSLLALMDHLNTRGRYRCVYLNVEVGQAAREEVAAERGRSDFIKIIKITPTPFSLAFFSFGWQWSSGYFS